MNVVDADADMAETLAGFGVAVCDLVVIVRLGAVVVGEFEDAFTVAPVVARVGRLLSIVRYELVSADLGQGHWKAEDVPRK